MTGAVTVTVWVFVAVPPRLSVTVSVTVKCRLPAYVWLGVAVVLSVFPSPKSQAYDATVPSGSDDAVPSNWQASSVQLLVNDAAGGWFGGPAAAEPSTIVHI